MDTPLVEAASRAHTILRALLDHYVGPRCLMDDGEDVLEDLAQALRRAQADDDNDALYGDAAERDGSAWTHKRRETV